jgi:hypothetical protein
MSKRKEKMKGHQPHLASSSASLRREPVAAFVRLQSVDEKKQALALVENIQQQYKEDTVEYVNLAKITECINSFAIVGLNYQNDFQLLERASEALRSQLIRSYADNFVILKRIYLEDVAKKEFKEEFTDLAEKYPSELANVFFERYIFYQNRLHTLTESHAKKQAEFLAKNSVSPSSAPSADFVPQLATGASLQQQEKKIPQPFFYRLLHRLQEACAAEYLAFEKHTATERAKILQAYKNNFSAIVCFVVTEEDCQAAQKQATQKNSVDIFCQYDEKRSLRELLINLQKIYGLQMSLFLMDREQNAAEINLFNQLMKFNQDMITAFTPSPASASNGEGTVVSEKQNFPEQKTPTVVQQTIVESKLFMSSPQVHQTDQQALIPFRTPRKSYIGSSTPIIGSGLILMAVGLPLCLTGIGAIALGFGIAMTIVGGLMVLAQGVKYLRNRAQNNASIQSLGKRITLAPTPDGKKIHVRRCIDGTFNLTIEIPADRERSETIRNIQTYDELLQRIARARDGLSSPALPSGMSTAGLLVQPGFASVHSREGTLSARTVILPPSNHSVSMSSGFGSYMAPAKKTDESPPLPSLSQRLNS